MERASDSFGVLSSPTKIRGFVQGGAMRRTVLAISVAALALVWSAARVSAQSEKTATGTVTAVAADSVTVKVGTQDMKFAVDNSTTVTARGAGTKTRKAEAAGTKPKVTELLSVGSNVEVKYHETGGTMHAASIRTIASAGKGGGSMSEEKPAAKTASGTVKNVAEQSLTISRA